MMGKRVRKVLNSVANNREYAQEIDGAIDLLGKSTTSGFTSKLVAATCVALAKEFDVDPRCQARGLQRHAC